MNTTKNSIDNTNNTDKITGVLNDLIKINTDRITGYEKAIKNLDNSEVMLKTLFSKVSQDSVEFKSQLAATVAALGAEPADDRTVPGAIYQAWMDVKATFSGNDTIATLEACEFGEDAAQRAYKDALKSAEEFPGDISQLIGAQKTQLRKSHDLIKAERDKHKEMAN
jgi:uncharacterized protein (TIGR02284 family)